MTAPIAAPITSVTVLEDRASVTRRGRVQVGAGQHRVVIERVSPVLVDKTLTARATGARVLDVRCERYLAPWRDPAAGATEPVAVLHAERIRLETERDAATARRDAAASEATAVAELTTAALRDLALAAARGISAPAAGEALAALDRQVAAARERRVIAELAAEELRGALTRLEGRIAQVEADAGEQAARLVIDLVADAAPGGEIGGQTGGETGGSIDVELVIDYVVPGAAWRPYHRAVLVQGADPAAPATVDWQTTACVWQATAEDWTDVALVFSLERPSLGVAPPTLADDELAARRRPDTVAVEARDHEQQTTGLGGEPPAGDSQVPGIDDGGLGVALSAARATVVADGAPHRVPVGGFRSAARIERVAIPLRSPWVHLRARLVNTGAAPLLAGPVDLVRSSGYVGRAEIGFVAPDEKFQLGFGPEADVRVHRTETGERDDAGLLGGWNVQTVRIAVRLSNLGVAPREVVVTERIPISEVEQVEVKPSTPDAYLLAGDPTGGEEVTQVTARAIDDRGLVTWSVELPPLGRRAVTLEYRIRSQRGVAGV